MWVRNVGEADKDREKKIIWILREKIRNIKRRGF
jgi:hypothetical protein